MSKKTASVGGNFGLGFGFDEWLNADDVTGPNLRGFGGAASSDGESDSSDDGFSKRDTSHRGPASPAVKGGRSMGVSRDYTSYFAPAGLSVDFRSGLHELPQGLAVLDGKGSNVHITELTVRVPAQSGVTCAKHGDVRPKQRTLATCPHIPRHLFHPCLAMCCKASTTDAVCARVRVRGEAV